MVCLNVVFAIDLASIDFNAVLKKGLFFLLIIILFRLIMSLFKKRASKEVRTLAADIKTQSEWVRNVFHKEGFKLDYSLTSFIEIDRFITKYSKGGEAIKGGTLSKNLGSILFGISSYVGETLIKNIPNSKWMVDEDDPKGEANISVNFEDGTVSYPGQKVIKRFKNGLEDGIYPYGYNLTKGYLKQDFDNSFWSIEEVEPFES